MVPEAASDEISFDALVRFSDFGDQLHWRLKKRIRPRLANCGLRQSPLR
jgi:hypothetical protein